MWRRLYLDKKYGIRKDGELFMICVSPVFIDTDDKMTIKGTACRGTDGLWVLLTRKKINTELIGKEDLKTNKKILIMSNAHLTRYQPSEYINITGGK